MPNFIEIKKLFVNKRTDGHLRPTLLGQLRRVDLKSSVHIVAQQVIDISWHFIWLKLKLKTNLYSAIKSGDSEALDGGTSQRGSQRRCGEIKMF